MDNSVVIKGNKNGIAVKMDASVSFDELKDMIRDKFTASAKFLTMLLLHYHLKDENYQIRRKKRSWI